MKIGTVEQGYILDLNERGQGILKLENLAVFLDGGVPGDLVSFEITQMKKNYATAVIKERIEDSAIRQVPPCPYADECGGCQIQHIRYEEQLNIKQNQVKNILRRIGGMENLRVLPILGMEQPFRYRNKVQMPIQKRDGKYVIGFYHYGTHQVVNVEECLIQHPKGDLVAKVLREFLEQQQIPVYEETTKQGHIRHLLVKVDFQTEQLMVVLVGKEASLPKEEMLIQKLREVPGVVSILYNQNSRPGNAVLGNRYRLLWGQEKLEMHLRNFTFLLSAPAFFQVNLKQTEVLYDKVLEFADLKGEETVYDLYCGTGSISLFLAQRARKVIGVELIPEAIHDAKENAEKNHIENVDFYVGEAETVFPKLYQKGLKADVVVVDPPRKGCEQNVLDTILEMGPQKVIYVSCNPATLARDLKFLSQNAYQVEKVQPVDLFCHSMHVETVCLLSKKCPV